MADWWPDGSALLLVNRVEGRDRLLRYDLSNGEQRVLATEPGIVMKARVRPDGRVWFLHEQGHRRRLILDDSGEEVLALDGPRVPPSRPYESWEFANPLGQRVHGFYVTPRDSDGPFPTIMLVHGGPTCARHGSLAAGRPGVRRCRIRRRAWSTTEARPGMAGSGEMRSIGDIGGPELEDVNAGLADLVLRGLADPQRAVIAGHSWGGYVTLLELGKHPDLWCCGVAGVPVGDYEAGYEDLSPLLQAYDRALLGGAAPKDVPELMRDRNAINFADGVRAPVLFLIGRNDSRCPYRQAMLYVERLEARDHPHEVYVFETGHGSFDVDERVRQARTILDFLARNVPGTSAAV